MFVSFANVRSVSMIIRDGITTLIIRNIARRMFVGVMRIITGITSGNILTDDGMDILMMVNGIRVNTIAPVIPNIAPTVLTITTVNGARIKITVPVIISITTDLPDRRTTGIIKIKIPITGKIVIKTGKTKIVRKKIRKITNDRKVSVLKCIAEAESR